MTKESGLMKASIIIPVFNGETFLLGALDSCLRQTLSDFEVIIVDDHSDDDTATIAQSYCQEDGRFRLIRNAHNVGQGASRNKALDQAQGDYVAFLDADDSLEPTFLEEMVNSAEQHSSDVVVCEYRLVHENGDHTFAPMFPSLSTSRLNSAQIGTVLSRAHFCFNKLYRRSFLNAHGISFGEGYIYEDNEFVVGSILRASTVSCVPQALYVKSVRDGSSSAEGTASAKHSHDFLIAIRAVTERWGDDASQHRKTLVRYWLGRGAIYTWKQRRIPAHLWPGFWFQLLHASGRLLQLDGRSKLSLPGAGFVTATLIALRAGLTRQSPPSRS